MVYGTTKSHAPYWNEEENRRAENAELARLGAYSLMAFGTASPVALAAMIYWRGPSLLTRLVSWWRNRHRDLEVRPCADRATELRERKCGGGGSASPSGEQVLLDEIMGEIRAFKWIEAERAGRDIWRELDPTDPDKPAREEWIRRHYRAWLAARRVSARA